MAKISLKNFRKYETLDPLFLNDINIFVGKNNAGKSTVVKAIMLALDNLRSLRWESASRLEYGMNPGSLAPRPYFRFDANDFHNLHIGTFERAKCNYIDEQRISFCIEYRGIEFTIVVSGVTGEAQVSLPIDSIKIDFGYDTEHHPRRKGCYEFDFVNQTMTFSLEPEVKNEQESADSINDTIANIDTLLSEWEAELKVAMEKGDALAIAELQPKIKKYQQSKKTLLNRAAKSAGISVRETFPLYYHNDGVWTNHLAQYIRTFTKIRENESDGGTMLAGARKNTWSDAAHKEIKAQREKLASYVRVIDEAARAIESAMDSINVDYIQAHAETQKLILSAEQRQDINSRVIHEFYQENIQRGSKADRFVGYWLERFEIGKALQIVPLDGEGYYVRVDTGSSNVHLADMGMGSIQLVILILRLATIANRIEKSGQPWWVIIEEPEQNIHPMLQSRLADLFKEFQKEFSSTLIIETHSEYLIRKTQVLVTEADFKKEEHLESDWPISIYYFPHELNAQPYKMVYEVTGGFKNSFGEGFFDEAANLDMEIIRKEMSQAKQIF